MQLQLLGMAQDKGTHYDCFQRPQDKIIQKPLQKAKAKQTATYSKWTHLIIMEADVSIYTDLISARFTTKAPGLHTTYLMASKPDSNIMG